MGSDDGGAGQSGDDRARKGSSLALLRVIDVENGPDEAFSRGTNQQRVTQGDETWNLTQDHQIVLDPLAEAQSRIQDDPRTINPMIFREGRTFAQKNANLLNDMVIMRPTVCLHLRRRAPTMHQDDAYTRAGDDADHFPIVPQGGRVVDEVRSGFDRGGRHRRQTRVNRDGDGPVRGANRFNDGNRAFDLLLRSDRLGAGPRGFGAYVDDGRPFGDHLAGPCCGAGRIEVLPGITERVGGNIQHAHHQGHVGLVEAVIPEAQCHFGTRTASRSAVGCGMVFEPAVSPGRNRRHVTPGYLR